MAMPARPRIPVPPVPRAIQPRLAPHVQAALRPAPPRPQPAPWKPPVLQKSEADPLVVKKRSEMVLEIGNIIVNGQKSMTRKGWVKTAGPNGTQGQHGAHVATYTNSNSGDILDVYNDIDMSGGNINGIHNGQLSFIGFLSGNKGVAEQTYMDSKPQGKGIGTILSYEGALILKQQGYTKIKTGMINKNSAKLADTLNEDTGCCSCGCFLVTACAEARGLPDDCEELQVLRAFRDGYLMESEETRAMVAFYYEIAPRIVAAVKASDTAKEELESIYHSITHCVDLIRNQDFETALRLYRNTVAKLAVRFLPDSPGASEGEETAYAD